MKVGISSIEGEVPVFCILCTQGGICSKRKLHELISYFEITKPNRQISQNQRTNIAENGRIFVKIDKNNRE
jgi:hypothetical protein